MSKGMPWNPCTPDGGNGGDPCCLCTFAVGPDGSGCPFQSLQDAYDAAKAAGFGGVGNPEAWIPVLPGTYIEDLAIDLGGIAFTGVQGEQADSGSAPTLLGEVLIGTPIGEAERYSWSGINVFPQDGDAFRWASFGSGAELRIAECILSGNTAFQQVSGSDSGQDTSFLEEVTLLGRGQGNGAAPPALFLDDAAICFGRNLLIELTESPSTDAVQTQASANDVQFEFVESDIRGQVDIGGTTVGIIKRCTVGSPALGFPIVVTAPASLTTENVCLRGTDTGISGTGDLRYAQLTLDGPFAGGAVAVGGVVVPMGVRGAENDLYTPAVLANWSGLAPASVADALDRIAAAIGPIA